MINNIRITEVSYVSQKNDTLDLPVCPKSLCTYMHALYVCLIMLQRSAHIQIHILEITPLRMECTLTVLGMRLH